ANGVFSVQAEADLTTSTDKDFYSVWLPTGATGLTIQLQRQGLSLVTPRVTVYDANNRVVATTQSVDPLGGDLTINLGGLKRLSSDGIGVEGARGDIFDVGSYRLRVQTVGLVNSLLGVVNNLATTTTTTLLNDDLHTDDSPLTALNLFGSAGTNGSHFNAAY